MDNCRVPIVVAFVRRIHNSHISLTDLCIRHIFIEEINEADET